eukprot:6414159-Prymnesium_polylepis.2
MDSHMKARKILVDVLGSMRNVSPRPSGNVRCSPARTAARMRLEVEGTLPTGTSARPSFELLDISQPMRTAASATSTTRGHNEPAKTRVR